MFKIGATSSEPREIVAEGPEVVPTPPAQRPVEDSTEPAEETVRNPYCVLEKDSTKSPESPILDHP
jgi:hypothetical protein